MQVSKYLDRLFVLQVTTGMNLRYHQALESWWGVWDKVIKSCVIILTVISLVLSVPGTDMPYLALWLAIFSSIAALILNVVPVGDWEKTHGELFRLWSDLRGDCDAEQLKVARKEETDSVQAHHIERLGDLEAKANALHAMQRSPIKWFLDKCEAAELKSHQPKEPIFRSEVGLMAAEAATVN